jgi:hypothetical protein
MTYGYIEDFKFAVEVFDEGRNLLEVPASEGRVRLKPEAFASNGSGR